MSSVNIWDGEHCKNSKLLAAVKYCYRASILAVCKGLGTLRSVKNFDLENFKVLIII